MPTRRAITIALAAVPFAGVAAAASTPDLIFAAIEKHRAALALVRAMEAAGNPDEDNFNALVGVESDRLAELLEMTPTTPAGCAAMLRHVGEHANREDEDSESQLFSSWHEPIKDPAATLLGRIASVLEGAAA